MRNPASNVPKDKHPTAEQLFDEVTWIAKKLIEARDALEDAPLVVTYLDTNGNERQKPNPSYEAYNSLLASFIKASRALDDMLNEVVPESRGAKIALDDVMVMVNKAKVAK